MSRPIGTRHDALQIQFPVNPSGSRSTHRARTKPTTHDGHLLSTTHPSDLRTGGMLSTSRSARRELNVRAFRERGASLEGAVPGQPFGQSINTPGQDEA